MPDLTSVVLGLPYPVRVLAASARGVYLRRWRYGPETEGLVAEARDREVWAEPQWRTWQEERLAAMLDRAVRVVPYYRRMWQERRRLGDKRSWEVLQHWPVLTKEEVRRAPEAFIAEDRRKSKLFRYQTSGSTGTPLTLYVGRRNLRKWYALFEARWRGWHGVSREDRWVIFGGQMVARSSANRPPYWVWNQGMLQLYMSSTHVASWSVRDMANAIANSRVVYALGYPSAMYEFAKVAEDRSIRVPKMKVVVSNAEPLFEYQRQVIGKAFQAPVIDTYGSAEMVVAAGECGQGGLHLWPDAGLLEIASDELNNPVEEGQPGKLICTGLLNDDMPLIRFDIGDRGTMCPPGPVCCCGRSLPMLRGVDGRADDVVLTPDGRRVGRLDPAFKAGFPIRCAQVIQETEDRIRVLVEPAHGYSARTADEIVGALSRMLGAMEIAVEETERIPRGPNGKLRGVINRLLVESE